MFSKTRYGDDVESYLEVYLKRPNLPKTDIARALMARGNARKAAGDKLQAKAQQGNGPSFMSTVLTCVA